MALKLNITYLCTYEQREKNHYKTVEIIAN